VFAIAELLDELAMEYETLGRVEDALAAADAAVAAGLRSQPDPRCLRAEILMRAGRVAEAAPIWAAVRVDTPEDVWLYNNAGLEYAAAGDHEVALAWLTDGLRLALRTGDPQRLVDQLADLRQVSLAALERPADALQDQAAAFLAERDQAAVARREPARQAPPMATEPQVAGRQVAWVWLPASEYETALAAWPDLRAGEVTGPTGHVPHAEYCRALEQRLRTASDAGMTGLRIAPVRVSTFHAWCSEHGHEPGRQARAEYAAQLAARRDPGLIAWPPGRNQPCWCGSGRKYKKCCGSRLLTPTGPPVGAAGPSR
jgi:tetratricopeptide (TPR) repeat protein